MTTLAEKRRGKDKSSSLAKESCEYSMHEWVPVRSCLNSTKTSRTTPSTRPKPQQLNPNPPSALAHTAVARLELHCDGRLRLHWWAPADTHLAGLNDSMPAARPFAPRDRPELFGHTRLIDIDGETWVLVDDRDLVETFMVPSWLGDARRVSGVAESLPVAKQA